MTQSTKYTYGHKWTIFFASLVCNIVVGFVGMILVKIFGSIGVGFLTFIVAILAIALYMTIGISLQGVLYRLLVIDKDHPNEPALPETME